MKKEILVSVIMSVYNTQKEFLVESIDSILNQTYKTLEFIIVCDGDYDSYEFIKNKFEDERIKLILHEKNEKLPKSLNDAIKVARGKYIARMDSDDICLKNRIERQVKFMEKNNLIDVCGMYAKCFESSNSKKYNFFIKPQEIHIQNLFMSPLIHPTVMIRKSYLTDNDYLYDEKCHCAEDYELWSRIVKNNNVKIIPQFGIKYRVHEKQTSVEKNDIQLKSTKDIIRNNSKKINDVFDDENFRCLLMLGSKIDIDEKNYIEFSSLINKLIKDNKNFNQKLFKKIVYVRYFHILLKNKILIKKCWKILKNKDVSSKIIKIYNIKYLLKYIYVSYIKY